MIRLFLRSSFALMLLATAVSALGAATFDAANQLYDRQQYAEAKRGYEQLLSGQAASANLLYNLGNTEYRLGSPGRAILNYERALALEPAHPEARANLSLLRTQTGAQLLTPSLFDRLVPPVSESVMTVLLAVGGWLFIFALAALLFLRKVESAGAWLALVAGGLLAAWSGVALWRIGEARSIAIVLEASAEARTAPADRAAMVESLPAGSEVRVLGERGDWTYCELPGARRGWLSTRTLEALRPAPPA